MTNDQLRAELDRLLDQADRPHVERLSLAAAIVSAALRERSLEATLVGGGAIEFYDPGGHTTSDIDLVVERREPVADLERALADTFRALGFSRKGRHWIRDELFVEIPGTAMTEPTETFTLGPYTLRVVRKEIVLGERIVGFKHWRYTAYGAQAIDMIASFGDEMDDELLRSYLLREDAEDAYEALQTLARSAIPITEDRLERELDRIRGGGQSDEHR